MSTTSSVLLPLLHWCWLSSRWCHQLHWHCQLLCTGIIALICASIAALVVLALLPLLCWCYLCLWRGLPHCPWLSTCQLNKGKDAYKLTARCMQQQQQWLWLWQWRRQWQQQWQMVDLPNTYVHREATYLAKQAVGN